MTLMIPKTSTTWWRRPARLGCVLLLIAPSGSAEVGYEYHGDLNGDGVEDSLVTGPQVFFGTGGGPLVLKLSQPGGAIKTMEVGGIPGFIALEKGATPRLYLYWHLSARNGTITQQDLFGACSSREIAFQGEDGGDDLGNRILNVIFDPANLLTFKTVQDYTPPPNPTGEEWGK